MLFMEASTCCNMTLDTYTLLFFLSIVTSKMVLFGTVFNSLFFKLSLRKQLCTFNQIDEVLTFNQTD